MDLDQGFFRLIGLSGSVFRLVVYWICYAKKRRIRLAKNRSCCDCFVISIRQDRKTTIFREIIDMASKKQKPVAAEDKPSLLEKISGVASELKTDIVAGASAVSETIAEKFTEVKEAIKKKVSGKTRPAKKAVKKAAKKVVKAARKAKPVAKKAAKKISKATRKITAPVKKAAVKSAKKSPARKPAAKKKARSK
ncbi:MAG: hypothetical protein J0H29_01580 [Sphingobacteriales bacterium]|nr:hypothetical protein [Sphingobacteriales bacterium]